MSELYLPLFALFAVTVGSVIVHEAGHVLTTKALGGTYHGLVWRWYGVCVMVEPPPGSSVAAPRLLPVPPELRHVGDAFLTPSRTI